MTAILNGIYKQGTIELLDVPPGLNEGAVRVILIAQQPPGQPTPLTYAKYPGDQSTPDDFEDAQWHGEEEFEAPHGQ